MSFSVELLGQLRFCGSWNSVTAAAAPSPNARPPVEHGACDDAENIRGDALSSGGVPLDGSF
jgi:hypothetical protein